LQKFFVDQIGDIIQLQNTPTKIVSLVPSQTELLSDLKMDKEVIGITKFCIHPKEWYLSKKRVGGTKNPDINLIIKLKPDLIIANKEENRQEDISLLKKHAPVWVSNVHNLSDAYQMIRTVGAMLNKSSEAEVIIQNIMNEKDQLLPFQNQNKLLHVCYLIWKDPYMSVGADTFIHDMINQLGWINVFGHKLRYPVTQIEEIKSLNPNLILLSSEPYPFKEKHSALFDPISTRLVDGESFSWYGSRLTHSFSYFRNLKASIQSR